MFSFSIVIDHINNIRSLKGLEDHDIVESIDIEDNEVGFNVENNV
jgi:hypothetical protein